ncbi:hypothetical protein CDAR_36941 [Caerostris darwini]|uniref:Uncharacterized protein n=1 Tax=Caerostris darwini TaxID=1538125 RepID=A0AAV4UVK5_9ARAC|nr:hypothetical protein CDAR_36941 [Caerostris darwini]
MYPLTSEKAHRIALLAMDGTYRLLEGKERFFFVDRIFIPCVPQIRKRSCGYACGFSVTDHLTPGCTGPREFISSNAAGNDIALVQSPLLMATFSHEDPQQFTMSS